MKANVRINHRGIEKPIPLMVGDHVKFKSHLSGQWEGGLVYKVSKVNMLIDVKFPIGYNYVAQVKKAHVRRFPELLFELIKQNG